MATILEMVEIGTLIDSLINNLFEPDSDKMTSVDQLYNHNQP